MRDTIDMARKVYGVHTEWTESQLERLKQFEAIVRADERDRAMRENAYVQAEREACARLCDALHYEVDAYGAQCAAAIRARK